MFAKIIHTKFATGTAGRFTGIAASFSSTPDRQGDIIVPGAFAATLSQWDARGGRIPVLLNHDHGQPIGALVSARETPAGLEVEGQLAAEVEGAERAMRLLETGALSMSIGYAIPQGGARLRADGVRELVVVDLAEVSLVAIPADPRAVVRQAKASIRDFEAAVRDALFLTKSEARRLAAVGYPALVRDAQPEHAETLDPRIVAALNRFASLSR
jgi:HK97 family phage prohead protease